MHYSLKFLILLGLNHCWLDLLKFFLLRKEFFSLPSGVPLPSLLFLLSVELVFLLLGHFRETERSNLDSLFFIVSHPVSGWRQAFHASVMSTLIPTNSFPLLLGRERVFLHSGFPSRASQVLFVAEVVGKRISCKNKFLYFTNEWLDSLSEPDGISGTGCLP